MKPNPRVHIEERVRAEGPFLLTTAVATVEEAEEAEEAVGAGEKAEETVQEAARVLQSTAQEGHADLRIPATRVKGNTKAIQRSHHC